MIPPTGFLLSSYIKGSILTAFRCTPTVLCSQAAAVWYLKIQRKMLRLSTAATLLLAAWFGGLVLGEVSDDFSQCLDFFYNSTPPRGLSRPEYQPICQRYRNRYRFASLYDRQRRAPLYSAYQLKLADGKRPSVPWMYEPQVTKTTGHCGRTWTFMLSMILVYPLKPNFLFCLLSGSWRFPGPLQT